MAQMKGGGETNLEIQNSKGLRIANPNVNALTSTILEGNDDLRQCELNIVLCKN